MGSRVSPEENPRRGFSFFYAEIILRANTVRPYKPHADMESANIGFATVYATHRICAASQIPRWGSPLLAQHN